MPSPPVPDHEPEHRTETIWKTEEPGIQQAFYFVVASMIR